MSAVEKVKAALSSSGRRRPRRQGAPLSEETTARLLATVLWLVVGIAAVGGAVAWLRPSPAPVSAPPVAGDDRPVGEAWVAAVAAERFIGAYLTPGPETADRLASLLGYAPELPSGGDDAVAGAAGSVRTIGLEPVGEGYWAATVEVAGDDGGQRFWRVGVTVDGGVAGIVSLPTPVVRPGDPVEAQLAAPLQPVPPHPAEEGDAGLVEAVEGFLAAYGCGQGDVGRWLAPETTIEALDPPVCEAVALERWGTTPAGDRAGSVTVVVEALLKTSAGERRVTFSLLVVERDGRWEVAELLPAPPLANLPVVGAGEERVP